MSLLQDLIAEPSGLDRYLSMAPMLAGGNPPRDPQTGQGVSGTSDWEQAARRYFIQQEGYTPQQWRDVDWIIERESNWDPNAVNESSGAYGIPQILPSAHPNAGLQNDPMGQIRWLANYLEDRYGSPQAARDFKEQEGWY